MKIKVLGICGSPTKDGNTEVFLRQSLEAAQGTGDVAQLITIADKDINDCRQCNWCMIKQEEGKFCAQQDDMVGIYPEVLKTDALLLASPVHSGRLSGHMARLTSRLRCLALGKFYNAGLRNKIGGALAVGWGRNTGVEVTLISLASTILVLEMILVSTSFISGSIFGAAGVSSKHGLGKFDIKERLGILKDEFGLQEARSLGKRVAEVAKLIKAWPA